MRTPLLPILSALAVAALVACTPPRGGASHAATAEVRQAAVRQAASRGAAHAEDATKAADGRANGMVQRSQRKSAS